MRTTVNITIFGLFVLANVHCGQPGSSTTSGTGGAPPGTGGADTGGAPPGTGEFTAPCTKNGDCASSLCQPVGEHQNICTKACSSAADCPPSPDWSCGAVPGAGMLCLCSASGAEECDGQDNDCNGVVDDGATCPTGQVCQGGACVCPPANKCGSKCVDKSTDKNHCGQCGNWCGVSGTCEDGKCKCAAGTQLCGGSCVSTSYDDDHCGGCFKPCAAPATCQGGKCTCPSQQTMCGGTCADTSSDAKHCGGCSKACPASATCQGGQCVCEPGYESCNGLCEDLYSDPHNCGACGHDCQGAACNAGICAPIKLGDLPSGVQGILVDATHVYVSASGTPGAIYRIPKTGGALTAITPPDMPPGTFSSSDHFAVNSTRLFWIGGLDNSNIFSMPKAGSAIQSKYVIGTRVWALAVDDTDLWFGTTAIFKWPLGSWPAQQVYAAADPTEHPAHLRLDGSDVFWTTNYGVYKNNTKLPPFVWSPSLWVGPAAAYISQGNGLYALDKVQGTESVVDSGWGFTVKDVAADATTVYWTTDSGLQLMSKPIGGSSSFLYPVASGQGITWVAVDATSVYWTSDSGLWKMAK